MTEKVYAAPSGEIHYWAEHHNKDGLTLVFLPGLTAGHNANTDQPALVNALIEQFVKTLAN